MNTEIKHFHLLQKRIARKAVAHAIEDGRLQRQPCSKCGAAKAQAHHDDYSKPLEVEWLCAKCHSQFHNQKHPLTKLCVVCGTEFAPHATKRRRALTCSPRCRSARLSKKLSAKPTIPPWAKLDKATAEVVRARYAAGGISQRTLAREFGVHHSQIGAIVRNEAWT